MDIRKYNNDPSIVQAMWVFDSETSEEFLINLQTSEVIAKRENGKIVDPHKWEIPDHD